MWPLPRASQTDEDDEAGGADDSRRPPPAKKAKRGGSMTGHEWAATHGNAWKKFLEEKLKKCECDNPRVSHSHRAKALKEDEGEGIAPGEPAGCLVCFAPIDRVVRPSPPPCPPLAQAAFGSDSPSRSSAGRTANRICCTHVVYNLCTTNLAGQG